MESKTLAEENLLFFLYIQSGVLLTKGSLTKINHSATKKMFFIVLRYRYLFIAIICDLSLELYITGLTPPKSTSHMRGNCLTSIENKRVKRDLYGTMGVCIFGNLVFTIMMLVFDKK